MACTKLEDRKNNVQKKSLTSYNDVILPPRHIKNF